MLQQLRRSVLGKVIGLMVLTVLLCIPLSQISLLNQERGRSQQEAAQELADTYTGAQTLIGPLLVLPYVESWMEAQRDASGLVIGQQLRSKKMIHLVFPQKLAIDGRLTPQERYRGIFRIPFYTLDASLEGAFPALAPDAVPHSEKASRIEPGVPYVLLDVSDLRGLDGSPGLRVHAESLRFAQRAPGVPLDARLGNGIHAPLAGAALAAFQAGEPLPFALRLGLVGQERLSVVPIAEETTAHLRSPWAHPSFGGYFLASERSVTAQGFDATWRVASLVTSARQQLADELKRAAAEQAPDATAAGARASLQSFDVSLAQPLNVYAMSTRAVKYGALFIGLVLMATFMFELFRKLRLHPVQYGLVGLSIALFFLLPLAFSEKIAFWLAYAGAAGASVLLLGVYFSAVLGGWRRGALLGAYVALLYGALYGLLASESNALLLGSLLVFGMLAVLMLATRRVDWYALNGVGAPEGGGRPVEPTGPAPSLS
jgi:inner membrane protein